MKDPIMDMFKEKSIKDLLIALQENVDGAENQAKTLSSGNAIHRKGHILYYTSISKKILKVLKKKLK